MSDPFLTAYSALEARMKILDVISNNLANSGTTGFKRDFGHVLEAEEGFDVATALDLSPGDMIVTHNPLDAAISGSGFFGIQTPTGIRYTRAGNFSVNEAGDLVTKDGMKVLDDSDSPINVGQGEIAIQENGTVTADGAEVATLKIVTFKNKDQLQKEGLQRFAWNGAASDIEPVAEPRVKSGHLEHSNVNSAEEMVRLIGAYRDFEAVQRTVKVLMTDMNARLIQELGRLG